MRPEATTHENGQPTDWGAVIDYHRRWLRTVVLARLGRSDATDEVSAASGVGCRADSAGLPRSSAGSMAVSRSDSAVVAVPPSGGARGAAGSSGTLSQAESNGQAANADPLDWLLADEQIKLVKLAIGRLAPRDREILLLKYTEDWNCREIAAHLGVSESAVTSRLNRARKRLRQELAKG